MNSISISTYKTTYSTGQKSLSFASDKVKTARYFLTRARRFADVGRVENGEQILAGKFKETLESDKKSKSQIILAAKNLIAFYMTEMPAKECSKKIEEVGRDLHKKIGQVGLRFKDELFHDFRSIHALSGFNTKELQRKLVDNIVTKMTYNRFINFCKAKKGQKLQDNNILLD